PKGMIHEQRAGGGGDGRQPGDRQGDRRRAGEAGVVGGGELPGRRGGGGSGAARGGRAGGGEGGGNSGGCCRSGGREGGAWEGVGPRRKGGRVGQQCRRRPGAKARPAGDDAGELGPRGGDRPARAVLPDAGGGAGDDRAGQGWGAGGAADHVHHVDL